MLIFSFQHSCLLKSYFWLFPQNTKALAIFNLVIYMTLKTELHVVYSILQYPDMGFFLKTSQITFRFCFTS